jgi:hypothetical protein
VAAHGLIAPIDSTMWDKWSPPLGYQCHCAVDELSVYDLERMGLVRNGRVGTRVPATFSAASPDPGFGSGRPDRRTWFGGTA